MALAASRRGLIESAAALAFTLVLSVPALAQNAVGKGLYVGVPSPLTSEGYKAVKNRVDAAIKQPPERKPSVIIFDFNPGEKDAAGTDFGTSYELADYIYKLGGT